MTAYCRWKQYSQGLSHNQHKLIRNFARKELKNSAQMEELIVAKSELHEHFLNATSHRKRADALKAARYADLTSSKLTYKEHSDYSSDPLQSDEHSKLYIPRASKEVSAKDIPDFDSFSM